MSVLEWIRYGVSALLITAGIVTVVISVIGVFRFKFAVNRMHCAAIIDTLGLLLVLAGLMVAAPTVNYALKMLVIIVLFWVGSPLTSHLLTRMELVTDTAAPLHVKEAGARIDELVPEEEESK